MDSKLLYRALASLLLYTQIHCSYYDRPGRSSTDHACDVITAVPEQLRNPEYMRPEGISYFYQKYTHAYGIPVVGSTSLPDSALRRACYVVRFLFADRPDIRQAYYAASGRFALMSRDEVTTDLPEYSDVDPYWNTRARGLGATVSRPLSMAAEENALCYSDDLYRREDIVLHEYAHGLHTLGVDKAIKGFHQRLYDIYVRAMNKGLWRNTYALSNVHEYFAEGVQTFFDAEAYSNPPDGIHNHVNTRRKLKTYDPELYNLIRELFPCQNHYIDRCDGDREAEHYHPLRMDCTQESHDSSRPSDRLSAVMNSAIATQQQWVATQQQQAATHQQQQPATQQSAAPGRGGDRVQVSTSALLGAGAPSEGTSGTKVVPTCGDIDTRCPRLAELGWCGNSAWTQSRCPVSCGLCDPTDTTESPAQGWTVEVSTHRPTPASTTHSWSYQTTRPTPAKPPAGGNSRCRDRHTRCPTWANSGLCERSPNFMSQQCAASCRACTSTASTRSTATRHRLQVYAKPTRRAAHRKHRYRSDTVRSRVTTSRGTNTSRNTNTSRGTNTRSRRTNTHIYRSNNLQRSRSHTTVNSQYNRKRRP